MRPTIIVVTTEDGEETFTYGVDDAIVVEVDFDKTDSFGSVELNLEYVQSLMREVEGAYVSVAQKEAAATLWDIREALREIERGLLDEEA